MLKLAAYADRLSVRPLETIRFHAANATGAPVTASLVRVVCADPNPAGPGIKLEPLAVPVQIVAEPQPQTVAQGSYAIIDAPGLAMPSSLTLWTDVFPTRIAGRRQGLISWAATDGSVQLDLAIAGDGCIEASLQVEGRPPAVARTENPITEDKWFHAWLTLDNGGLSVRRGEYQDLSRGIGFPGDTAGVDVEPITTRPHGARILLGAIHGAESHTALNGRLQGPRLYDEGNFDDIPASMIAEWRFERGIDSQRVVDLGANALHGTLVNTPTRAVTGATWSGREMCFRHAPEQYGAIHFHEDDIDDCRWPVTHEWTVPAGLKSGNYALMLEAGDARENVPFFIVPPKGTATARLAVLVSTYTYTVYGNHERLEWQTNPAWREAWKAQAAAWGAYPYNPGDHREYGLSTYNTHSDGSGIAHASWHRPMLNVRVGYMTYPYPDVRGSGLRHYPADTHLTAWLEAKGIAYDVITDEELHHDGADLLNRYAAVLTGTHPEYHTRDMLDALKTYRDGGGRLCYLGGNGFYWKIALDPARSGHIEIRRGEGGIRAWAADPGEYYNQFDGEYGGLWRRNGRPPQDLVGVGFTAQGNFHGSYYRRTAEAADPRVAWILSRVDGDIIGDFGLSAHGAAGFELDRTDKRLGTPVNAIVIARSENHPADAPWVLVPEEQLTHLATVAGLPPKDLIRADMTFFTTAGGRGAVFSTGSITYCGSLPHNGFDNPVSRLTETVVRRFLDPKPFLDA